MRLKILNLIAIALFLASNAHAQWNIVRETDKIMSLGTRTCFMVEFQNTPEETALDVWKDFVKKNFNAKIKKDRKTGEWVATEAKAAYVGSGVFTIYATVEQENKNAILNAWYDIGQPNFLNSKDNRDAAREVADVMRIYYYDVRRAVIGEEQKTAEKNLADTESKLKKLQKDNDSLHKSIDDYNAKIKKAQEDIQANTKLQESTIVDIDNQKKQIEAIKTRIQNVENEKQ